MFFPISVDNLFLNFLSLHRNHISIASGIALLISFCKIMEIMSAQIFFTKLIQFLYDLSFLLRTWDSFFLKFLIRLKQINWHYVIINSCHSIVTHIKTFRSFFYCKNSNIHWEFCIQILDDFLKINLLGVLVQLKFLSYLQLEGYAVAECMNFLICSCSS